MTSIRRRLGIAVAVFVALVMGGRTVGADCPPERDIPTVVFFDHAIEGFNASTEWSCPASSDGHPVAVIASNTRPRTSSAATASRPRSSFVTVSRQTPIRRAAWSWSSPRAFRHVFRRGPIRCSERQ